MRQIWEVLARQPGRVATDLAAALAMMTLLYAGLLLPGM